MYELQSKQGMKHTLRRPHTCSSTNPCSATTHHTQPAQTRVILAVGAQYAQLDTPRPQESSEAYTTCATYWLTRLAALHGTQGNATKLHTNMSLEGVLENVKNRTQATILRTMLLGLSNCSANARMLQAEQRSCRSCRLQ
jgi:hypothetical protein